jgi:hypothetical protein
MLVTVSFFVWTPKKKYKFKAHFFYSFSFLSSNAVFFFLLHIRVKKKKKKMTSIEQSSPKPNLLPIKDMNPMARGFDCEVIVLQKGTVVQ